MEKSKRFTGKATNQDVDRCCEGSRLWRSASYTPPCCFCVVTVFGYRHGFEPLPIPEAEFRSEKSATDNGRGPELTSLENGYDPELAKANRVHSHSANGGGGGGRGTTPGRGGKNGCLAVGIGGGGNGSSVHTRVNERLPLVEQRLGSPNGARELQGREVYSSMNGSALASARWGGGDIGQGGGSDAGSGENGGEKRSSRNACLREFLLPFTMLEEKRVRTVLFVYVLFSVSKRLISHPLHTVGIGALCVDRASICISGFIFKLGPLEEVMTGFISGAVRTVFFL